MNFDDDVLDIFGGEKTRVELDNRKMCREYICMRSKLK